MSFQPQTLAAYVLTSPIALRWHVGLDPNTARATSGRMRCGADETND